MHSIYTPYGGQQEIVSFASTQATLPGTIRFEWDGDHAYVVDVQSFQLLRRSIRKCDDGVTEQKIRLVKHFRGLSGLGLKHCKDVVEYFLAHFSRDAAPDIYSEKG